MLTPFDLHVLSTPPAFILSQDQTLNKKFFLGLRLTLANSLTVFTIFWFVSVRNFSESSQSCIALMLLYSLEFSGLHCCLFVKVLFRQAISEITNGEGGI